MPRPTTAFSQPNHSVLAVIECLQWLTLYDRPVSNIEMARLMKVHRNRANRLLKSLVMAGIASQGLDRKFAVGGGFHVLAAQSLHASGILRKALPVLESLHQFDCIVALGVLWKDMTAYLYYHQPNKGVSEGIGARGASQATQSSIGLALLAHLPPEAVDQLYEGRPIPDFPHLAALKKELADTLRRGYGRHAFLGNKEDTSVAVAIQHNGRYAYAVAMARGARAEDEQKRTRALREAAREIEKALHFRPQ